jgi:hypothetical protein
MDNTSENLTSEELEEIVAAVNKYLKLQITEQEYEDDISFWSVNEKPSAEQETDNDTLGTS